MKIQLDRQDGPNLPLKDGWRILDVPDGVSLFPNEILSFAAEDGKAEHVAVQARRHVIEPDGSYRLCCLVVPATPASPLVRADAHVLSAIDRAKAGASASALIRGGRG